MVIITYTFHFVHPCALIPIQITSVASICIKEVASLFCPAYNSPQFRSIKSAFTSSMPCLAADIPSSHQRPCICDQQHLNTITCSTPRLCLRRCGPKEQYFCPPHFAALSEEMFLFRIPGLRRFARPRPAAALAATTVLAVVLVKLILFAIRGVRKGNMGVNMYI